MRDLENRAALYFEPMIRGEAVMLDREAQTNLAAWIFEFFIISEFTDQSTAKITEKDRRYLMEKLAAPQDCSIFVGIYSGSYWRDIRYRHHGIDLDLIEHGTMKQITHKIHISTQTIGPLVFHCYGWDDPKIEAYAENSFDGAMSRIWPVNEDVLPWPSTRVVGDSEMLRISDDLMFRCLSMGSRL